MKRYIVAAVVAGLALSTVGEVSSYLTGNSEYNGSVTQYGDIALSHDEAREMCEELGLVYDYEAEGYTTAEFCVTQEQWDAQQEADYEYK
jgi:hypothetical protein